MSNRVLCRNVFLNLTYVLRMGCFPVSLTSFSHSATYFCTAAILRLCFNEQIWALSLGTVCDSQTSINPIDLIKIPTFVHHVWWPAWDNLSNSAYTDLTGFVTGTLIIFSQYPRNNCSCRVNIGYRPVSPYTARLEVWFFTPSACFIYFVCGGKYVVMQYALRLTTEQISTFTCDLYPNDLV